MLSGDSFMLMGVGGLFLVLGLALMIWGKREEKSYYEALARRPGDAREFMEHWPPRQQHDALKAGGWIALAISVVMLFTGGVLYLLS